MAIFFGPYSPSMAQASIRGACGFVLAGYTDIYPRRTDLGWVLPDDPSCKGRVADQFEESRFFLVLVCGVRKSLPQFQRRNG